MKKSIVDKERRAIYRKKEIIKKIQKAYLFNCYIKSSFRWWFGVSKLNQHPKNSSITRIRNRCVFTGRGRAVNKKFRVSRIVFRELACKGLLPGIQRLSR